MKKIISVDALGKKYLLRHQTERYTSLRDVIAKKAMDFGRRFRGGPRANFVPTIEEFWALRGVSFEVNQGDRVGIIGRNGAGKSTLLKILSRVTEPSTGKIKLRGRVASLLEVGTGFHPELTGRENIYLNGAILGMNRAEIRCKFDEIVAFSEVEKFLDTPVKRYSSGMYVRLAFAVAAHLEPEILLVDEVLAVGDASFQKKCLNKMESVSQQGRTVLFVSHNMPSISRLCERTILLDGGSVTCDGPSDEVLSVYLQSGFGSSAQRQWEDSSTAPGNDVVRLRAVRVRTETGDVTDTVDIRYPIGIEMEFDVLKPGHILVPNFHFTNEEGVYLFAVNDHDPEWRRRPRPIGKFTSTAWIPGNFLSEGTLVVGAAVSTMDPVIVHFYERDAVAFHVRDSLDGNSARGDYAGPFPGVVRPLLKWTTRHGAEDQCTPSRRVQDSAR
jgi:lipopolysaccharide transport system ATP-binding protein